VNNVFGWIGFFVMPDKLPFLPDDHHYAIAHVATRAAQLDHALEYSIDTQLFPRRETGKFLVRNLDTNRLVSLLHAVLLENFPEKSDLINAMMKDIVTARKERNEILHWLWGKGDDDTEARHGSMRPHREEMSKTKTARQIYDVAALMLEVSLGLMRLNSDWLKKHNIDTGLIESLPDEPGALTLEQSTLSSEQDQPIVGGLLDALRQPSPEK
jgi:hypothetical protein